MAAPILYSTELIGLPLYDLRGRKVGKVRDAAILPAVDTQRVDRFLVGGGWAWLSVRYDQVRSISLKGIQLSEEQFTPYHADEDMLRIARDLLDQQIIDANGRKVIRVTDLTFEIQPQDGRDVLLLTEVDIGLRSIVRRLLQGVVPPRIVRRLQRPVSPNSIDWADCNIVEPDPQRRLRLKLTNKRLEQMHPADLADIVEELSPEDRGAIFETIDSEVAAETLSEVEPSIQASILESLETVKAAEILEEMSPGEAAHVLAELEEETSQEILEELHEEPQTEIRELLEYEEGTAGGMMNSEFVAFPEHATLHDVMNELRQSEELLETLNVVFLHDTQGKLCGVVPLAKLLVASQDEPLRNLLGDKLISVSVQETAERAAEVCDKYNLLTLPVVDEDGRLVGTITADDIITMLRDQ